MSDRSFGDFAARMRKRKDAEPEQVLPPTDFEEIYRLRQRILGVLVRDARQSKGATAEECAAAVGVSPEVFLRWEYGEGAPSLPQVEMLAYVLDVPVSHFWGIQTLAANDRERQVPKAEYLTLRNRIVGAMLRRARKEAQLSPDELAERIGISEEELNQYEYGQVPVPLPVLHSISTATNVTLNFFLEGSSRVGAELEMGEDFKRFKEMSTEMRHFVVQPMNQSYLELAMRLSQMSVEELRGIAEGILNITY